MLKSTTTLVEEQACELANAGNPAAAIDLLEGELNLQPQVGAWRRLRATLLYREDRHEEAFQEAERTLTLAPLNADCWLALAGGYLDAGRRQSAADVLTALAKDEAFPHDLWSPLFDGLSRLGLWQAALDVSRRAAEHSPDDDLAYFSLAHAALRANQPVTRAIHLLERAVSLNPREPRYRATLAVQLLGVGRRQAAYECLTALDGEAVESLTCRCCLEKFLWLMIERGDAQRASLMAARLANLRRETKSKGSAEK